MNKAEFYIEKLNLILHPEGGYFRETYRSDEVIKEDALPDYYKGNRTFSTLIYFLLKGEQKSNLHKLKSDEVWHFYDGSAIKPYIINKDDNLIKINLGRKIEDGEVLQYVIKKEQWFCAEVTAKESFSLIGCTVSPGFDFSDFELGKSENLLNLLPQHNKLIRKFTSN